MIRNDFDPVLYSTSFYNDTNNNEASTTITIQQQPLTPSLPTPPPLKTDDSFLFQSLQQFHLPTSLCTATSNPTTTPPTTFFTPKMLLTAPILDINEVSTTYAATTTSSSTTSTPSVSPSPCFSPQSAFDTNTPPLDAGALLFNDGSIPHIDAIDEAIGTYNHTNTTIPQGTTQQERPTALTTTKPSCRGGNGMLVWCDVCDLCGKRFFKRGSLIRHIRAAHRSEKRKHPNSPHSIPIRLDCPKCPKTFSQQGSLNRHLRSIHESRKLHCQYCHLAFGQAFDLKRHQKRKHPHAETVIPREALPVSRHQISRRR